MFDSCWIVLKATRCWTKGSMYWYEGFFMSTTMKAAIHLGEDYNENLVANREHQLRRAQDAVRHHAEVDLESEARDSECLHDWMAFYSLDEISSLLYDKALKWAKAKVHVNSDSVLCQGMLHGHSEAKDKWKDQLQYFQELVSLCLFVCWIVGSLDSHWRLSAFKGASQHIISSPMDTEKYVSSMENHLSSSGIFSRTYNIADSQRGSGQNGSSSNKSRRIWRSNRLHVHVQRHRLDQERKL